MKTQKESDRAKKKISIKCECGFIVSGNSEDNAKANLKLHRKSKYHKKQIALENDISNGTITDISGANLTENKKEGVIET